MQVSATICLAFLQKKNREWGKVGSISRTEKNGSRMNASALVKLLETLELIQALLEQHLQTLQRVRERKRL